MAANLGLSPIGVPVMARVAIGVYRFAAIQHVHNGKLIYVMKTVFLYKKLSFVLKTVFTYQKYRSVTKIPVSNICHHMIAINHILAGVATL